MSFRSKQPRVDVKSDLNVGSENRFFKITLENYIRKISARFERMQFFNTVIKRGNFLKAFASAFYFHCQIIESENVKV